MASRLPALSIAVFVPRSITFACQILDQLLGPTSAQYLVDFQATDRLFPSHGPAHCFRRTRSPGGAGIVQPYLSQRPFWTPTNGVSLALRKLAAARPCAPVPSPLPQRIGHGWTVSHLRSSVTRCRGSSLSATGAGQLIGNAVAQQTIAVVGFRYLNSFESESDPATLTVSTPRLRWQAASSHKA